MYLEYSIDLHNICGRVVFFFFCFFLGGGGGGGVGFNQYIFFNVFPPKSLRSERFIKIFVAFFKHECAIQQLCMSLLGKS